MVTQVPPPPTYLYSSLSLPLSLLHYCTSRVVRRGRGISYSKAQIHQIRFRSLSLVQTVWDRVPEIQVCAARTSRSLPSSAIPCHAVVRSTSRMAHDDDDPRKHKLTVTGHQSAAKCRRHRPSYLSSLADEDMKASQSAPEPSTYQTSGPSRRAPAAATCCSSRQRATLRARLGNAEEVNE